MELIFEKKAISFEQFLVSKQDDVNEGALKNIALATLLGASSLAGYAGGTGTADFGDGTGARKYTTVRSEKAMQNYIKLGWRLEQTMVEHLIDDTVKEKNIEGRIYKIDLEQGFGSGLFDLSQESKEKIDSLFNQIYEEGSVISKVGIESSTDKTPISKRMTEATGIKDNKDLSEKRASSIIDYLLSSDLVSTENKDSIEKKLLVEQGGVNDPSARYVNLVVYAIPIVEDEPGSVSTTTSTEYMLSHPIEKGKKVSGGSNKPVKIITGTKENVGKFKSILCPTRY